MPQACAVLYYGLQSNSSPLRVTMCTKPSAFGQAQAACSARGDARSVNASDSRVVVPNRGAGEANSPAHIDQWSHSVRSHTVSCIAMRGERKVFRGVEPPGGRGAGAAGTLRAAAFSLRSSSAMLRMYCWNTVRRSACGPSEAAGGHELPTMATAGSGGTLAPPCATA